MKAKFFAATAIAACISIASCNWITHKSKNAVLSAGEYELLNITDTLTTKPWMPGDTLKQVFNSIKDSSHVYLNLISDSELVFKKDNENDTLKYYPDNANKTVYVKTDSSFHPYKLIQQSDSLINFFALNDSIYILLKKL